MKKFICFICVVLLLFTSGCGKDSNERNTNIDNNKESTVKGREFQWSNITLGDYIPKTKSNIGVINANSLESLDLTVYNTTSSDYDEYVQECINLGYVIDKELLTSSFTAYNTSGYEINLNFNDSTNSLNIKLNKEKEYDEMNWPTSGYGTIIPKPTSNVGNIERNTENEFVVYVGKMDKETFNEYIKTCQEYGFTVNESKKEDSFYAKNKDGYKLYVTYEGSNTIKIEVKEPEYEVTFDIECDDNIIFSKYDVKIYIDGLYEGTLKHGTKEKYKVTKKKGNYEVRFVNVEDSDVKGYINIDITKEETIKIKVHCYSSKIEATLLSGGKADTKKEEVKETSTPEPSKTDAPKTTSTPKPTKTPKPTATPKIDVCAGSSYRDDAKYAFKKAGEKLYPYGIKYHWIIDLKDFSYKGKCVWHIEVGVDVTNKYGAKRKGVAVGDVDFNKNVVKNFIVK